MLTRPHHVRCYAPRQRSGTAQNTKPPRTSSLILGLTLAVAVAAMLAQGIPDLASGLIEWIAAA